MMFTSPSRHLVLALAAMVCLVNLALGQDIRDPAVRSADKESKRLAFADKGAMFAPTRVLVRFTPKASASARNAAIGSVQGTRLRTYKIVPGLELIHSPLGWSHAVEALRRNPNVDYAEPDQILRPAVVPNDPFFSNLWGLHNTSSGNHDINAPEAWDLFTGAPNFRVAVIDTGVDYTHPDLAANIWSNPDETVNGVDDDGNGYIDDTRGWDFADDDNDPMDGNGHGTHVAGTIGAVGNNSIGVVGVNWQCKIVPFRTLGPSGGLTSDAVLALEYCIDKGIQVSNNSYGGGGYLQSFLDAINAAAAVNHIFVAAAGNAGANIDATPFYPASYDAANLISVASIDSNGARSSFSNYGATSVDLAAPGGLIYSTFPGGYGYSSGTSMSAPQVSGVAALVLGNYPSWTSTMVKDAILGGVRPISSMAGLCVTGGLLDAWNSLRPVLARIEFDPSPVTGGSTSTGTVVLNMPAEAGGAVVMLSSGDTAYATVPASVAVPASALSADFQIDTVNNGLATRNVTITGTYIRTTSAVLQVQTAHQAQFISQTVPSAVNAGASFSASITLKNTGTTTWSETDKFRLGSQNPNLNSTWGSNRVYLPAGVTVAPGQSHTFTRTFFAPWTAGSYNFQWRMMKELVGFFGEASPNVAISVNAIPNAAVFVSQTVPTSVAAGSSFSVSIRMRNTGTATWSEASAFRLGSRNPDLNTTWGFNRIFLPSGTTVAPGAEFTFTRTLTAPTSTGTYNFQWGMLKELVGFFGERSPNLQITVNPATTNNAQFVSQTVPATVTAGTTFSASVRMRNTGTTTWSEADVYRLGSQNPSLNTTWGTSRVMLPSGTTVAPGGEFTFTRTFTAPATAGTYNFQWRMLKEFVGFFGEASPNVAIVVSSGVANNAQFVSQTVPASVNAGASFTASVVMMNNGTATWTEVDKYRLGTQNPSLNMTWGVNRMYITGGASVASGQQYTFTRTFFAPWEAGNYNFQWRMLKELVGFFGQTSPNVAITVNAVPNAAVYESQTVPTSVAAGATFTASVTMKNTGTSSWSETDKYRLASRNPDLNTTWGASRVLIPGATVVAPGSSFTFSRTFTAPATPGTYNFQWSMVKEFVGFFGERAPNVVITVN